MDFKSQICTTREQSERLIALGLRKETADMCWLDHALTDDYEDWREAPIYKDWEEWQRDGIPAWSLDRLLEMLPSPIPISDDLPTFDHWAYLRLSTVSVYYYWEDYDGGEKIFRYFGGNGFFAAVVDATEWLIKEGYFDKEYLV